MFRAGEIYFVTTRTVQRRLLLRPDAYVNDIVGGVLAKGVQDYGIDLYGHVWSSNHPHLILSRQEEPERISDFMGWLKSNIAIKLGPHVDWKGPFWERRFVASPILDDETLIERLCYLLRHSVKERLVASPYEWPGVHCASQLAHGIKHIYNWHDWTRRSAAMRRGEPFQEKDFKTAYTIDLKPLPCWLDLDEAQRQAKVQALIDEIVEEEREKRRAEGKTVLGVAGIKAQRFHDKPKTEPVSTPRPLCHTTTKQRREQYRTEYHAFCADYAQASAAYRAGDLTVAFPADAFRPSLHPLRQQPLTLSPRSQAPPGSLAA